MNSADGTAHLHHKGKQLVQQEKQLLSKTQILSLGCESPHHFSHSQIYLHYLSSLEKSPVFERFDVDCYLACKSTHRSWKCPSWGRTNQGSVAPPFSTSSNVRFALKK